MEEISLNNKKIAKNTMLLYIRMLLIMIVTLYMSRIVLQTLGVIDYGIYNVVGGVVAVFSFLNSALGSSTQRFITYALGNNNENELKNIFSCSCFIHLIIALLILVLAETGGLWLLYNKLTIPAERMDAAFWAYQASIGACIINVVSVPYNSLIIAHEKMGVFAYISIFEVFLKILLVFAIMYVDYDKLILYASLILFVSIVIRLTYQIYCKKTFVESSFSRITDYSVLREMTNFSGWTLIGMMAWTCHGQGLNIILNIFLGPVVNAARAIADQVNNAVMQLVNNFQLAAKPQIIKSYACGNLDGMNTLVCNIASFSAYLLICLYTPLTFNLPYILTLWLGQYPSLAEPFVYVVLIQSLFQVVVAPVIMITHAVGKMKMPNITGGLTFLLTIPICYSLLKIGASAVMTVMASLIPIILKGFWDVYYAYKYAQFPIAKFYSNVLLKIILIWGGIYILTSIVHFYLPFKGIPLFFASSLVSVIISLGVIYTLGLNYSQKKLVVKYTYKLYSKIWQR